MRNLPRIFRAAIIGSTIQSALCVVSVASVLTGGIGPCGPTGDVPSVVKIVHLPGFWISGALLEDSNFMYLPLAIAITTLFLSVLVFIVLRFCERDGQSEIE